MASTTTQGSVSLTDMTVEQLQEKLKKHEFFIKLVKEELSKRKKYKKEDQTTDKKKDDKKREIDATKEDMKIVLEKNKIVFKTSSKKDVLYELVKKHNLIRLAEQVKKERLASSSTKDAKLEQESKQ